MHAPPIHVRPCMPAPHLVCPHATPHTYPTPQERVAELEAEAMGSKVWLMTGQVGAANRPLNSALEVDLDYDTTSERGGGCRGQG